MNNKGFTLMELMISISLVSVVMVFTLNLLNDIRAEEDIGTNKTADLTNRTIITKIVQNDFYNRKINQVGGLGSGTNRLCTVGKNVFVDDYNFRIKKCVVIYYKDNTCGLLAIGKKPSEPDGTDNDEVNKASMFMYATKDGGGCNTATGYVPEVWELTAASYDVSNTALSRSANTVEDTEENQLAGNLGNFFIMIKFPTVVPPAYSNTSMNFDLEFTYYTADINGFTNAGGQDRYMNYTNLTQPEYMDPL